MQKRTKIVCTLGPACETTDMIEKMIHAGMNVARLNFSHGTYENHTMLIKNVREAAARVGEPVAIMQDLQGPKIRVGSVPEEGVKLVDGEKVIFDTSINELTEGRIPVDWEELHQHVGKGERMLLADGKMECIVESVEGTNIHATVVNGGPLGSHKGINVPDSTINARAMTEKDKADARFGVEQGVDLIALSFVMAPEDVIELRDLIEEHAAEQGIVEAQPIKIITKIERGEAVKRIEEILAVADGMMVARGDLGVELPPQQVPVLQKQLVATALKHAKPVIVATQMLDSMQDNPRPTRAEVSDVANAVIDHADAVMLSNESAVGKYPVQTVETMAAIIRETEVSTFDDMPAFGVLDNATTTEDMLGGLSRLAADHSHAKAIILASLDGEMAAHISRTRPELPIVVGTMHGRLQRQMNLSWGVLPLFVANIEKKETFIKQLEVQLKMRSVVDTGDTIIILSGHPFGGPGEADNLHIHEVG
ncbi:MAG: pyruvate kinase [Candidatus Magasanikbacteria bacterium]|jgi:pyruvate kinase|nr:pyruvate kinase [Candidatus Magasanikbacteria bacterium]